MNLFELMDTSGSAMQAERMRAEVVAANMANAETTRTTAGGPYHRQHVVFAANGNGEMFRNALNASLVGAAADPAEFPSAQAVAALPLARANAGGPAGGVHI